MDHLIEYFWFANLFFSVACHVLYKFEGAIGSLIDIFFYMCRINFSLIFGKTDMEFGSRKQDKKHCHFWTHALMYTPFGPMITAACDFITRYLSIIQEYFDLVFNGFNNVFKDALGIDHIFSSAKLSRYACRFWNEPFIIKYGGSTAFAAFVACTVSFRALNVVEWGVNWIFKFVGDLLGYVQIQQSYACAQI